MTARHLVAALLIGCGSAAEPASPTDTVDTTYGDVPPVFVDTNMPDADTSADDVSEPDTATSEDTSADDSSAHDGTSEDVVTTPTLLQCTESAFDAPAGVGFEHFTSNLVVAAGAPGHSAHDVFALPGTTVTLVGKFAYGAISKDLEDEVVDLWVDRCAGFEKLATDKTDTDGRTHFALDTNTLGGPGIYHLRQHVVGDGTFTEHTLRVLPAGTQLVVFDIDGTLTTSDEELFKDVIADFFEPLFGGTYVPTEYPSAVALTQAWAAKGYVLAYVTGRPYWLTGLTRGWLASLGFADAALRLTDSNGEALPTSSGVAAYKTAHLASLQALGYVLVTAYGNAVTDIEAYANVGIPLDRTFIIGDHAGEGATMPLSGGYGEHLSWVAAQQNADQPFTLP
ncbi:MAG: hypothetical protein IV100_01600 [Myxococcales bacterium]|nr:hypothetical protein [Myxococcales bacterium]